MPVVVPFLNALQKEQRCIGDTLEESKEIARRVFSNALPKFAELMQTEKTYDLSAELKTIRSSRIRVKDNVQEIWGATSYIA